MQSQIRRRTARVSWRRGTRRSSRLLPHRYRDEDLHVFRYMSQISRRVTSEYIDKLLSRR